MPEECLKLHSLFSNILLISTLIYLLGYQSTAAKSFMEAVSRNERYGLFVRPIGSVLYFMTSLNTSREVIEDIQNIIRAGLDEAAIKDGFAKKASPSQDINTNQQQVKVAASY